jgi:hypothetical protein
LVHVIIDAMSNNVFEKKQTVFKSPDLNKLQAVVIDHRTKIYIALGADPEEARARYFSRRAAPVKA